MIDLDLLQLESMVLLAADHWHDHHNEPPPGSESFCIKAVKVIIRLQIRRKITTSEHVCKKVAISDFN
jgi:hypothetical protein